MPPVRQAAYEAFKKAREGKGTEQFIHGKSGTTSTSAADTGVYEKCPSTLTLSRGREMGDGRTRGQF
jgi:hypothetical protein